MKSIVAQEQEPEILVILLDFLGRTLLELEDLEVVANGILQEAACPAAPTCNLLRINFQLYQVIIVEVLPIESYARSTHIVLRIPCRQPATLSRPIVFVSVRLGKRQWPE
jgi:hypothetical protein